MEASANATRFWKRRRFITLALSAREQEPSSAPLSQPLQITHTEIWLRQLPPSFDGLTIVHLSDIHCSLLTPLREVHRAVQVANRLHPDVMALTGDYVTVSPSYIWPVARELGKLRARLGVFAVLGNHDFQVDAEEITRALSAQSICVLRDSNHALRAGPATVWLLGVDDLWWGSGFNGLVRASRQVPTRDAKILLCHNPLGIYQADACGIDLVLSGHTHGGQVRLPVVGSVYGRSRLGERFVEGWNRLNGTQIYISRGIGKVLLPLRLGCPPEIACLRLRRQ